MNWQRKLETELKNNSRIVLKDGKIKIIYYISKKEFDRIIKEGRIKEEIALQYVRKNGGIIIPYKIEDLSELKKLAEEQLASKPLQDFEIAKIEKIIDELWDENKEVIINNEIIMEYGFHSPAEVLYAIEYNDKKIKKVADKVIDKDETSLNEEQKEIENEEIEELDINDKSYKIRELITRLFKHKERQIIHNEGSIKKIGTIELITEKEKQKIMQDLNIDEESAKAYDITKIAEEVRDERKRIFLEKAASTYEKIIQSISNITGTDIDYLKSLTEEKLIREINKIKNNPLKSQELINLKRQYNDFRNVVLYYHENLIKWAVFQVKINNHSIYNTPEEEILEGVIDCFLEAYFSYIRKFNNENKPSRDIELTTYIINKIKDEYRGKNGNKGVYAGAKLKQKIYNNNSTIHLTTKNVSDITKVYNAKDSLRQALGREPKISELSDELGFSERYIIDILKMAPLYYDGVESLDGHKDTALDSAAIDISEEMSEAAKEAYIDAFEEDYEDEKTMQENMDELAEIEGYPLIDEGIHMDVQDEEEIIGYDDTLTRDVENTFLKEELESILSEIGERPKKILEMRFGLIDGIPHSQEEVAKKYGVTKSRIGQIESKALARLRHPSIRLKLWDYIDESNDGLYNPMQDTEEINKSR